MPLETIIAAIMVAALIFYALLGGADYGGGVWDLFAAGKRAKRQRELIGDAIGPVWEANHVWLILVVVILFTAFPPAFAAISVALHIPLSLLLIGIVLRGTAFTFRTYDVQNDEVQRRWSLVFSIASIFTPVLLGITLGAIASGTIRIENGIVTTGFFNSWLAPFPFAVGFFALALFAFLAAVYLTAEAGDVDLQEDFRKRAILSGIVVGVLALVVFFARRNGSADGSRRNQPKRAGCRSARFDRRFRRERVLRAVDAKIPTGANLRGDAGGIDYLRLGGGAVSVFNRAGHQRLFRRCAADYTAVVTRRTRGWSIAFVSFIFLSFPRIQKQNGFYRACGKARRN